MRELGFCVEWQGKRHPAGYGLKKYDGKWRRVHRLVWERVNGPIPPGMCICHHCDNPPCYRIDHLFIGTQRDNVRDMFSKGRGHVPPPRTEQPRRATCKRGHPLEGPNLIVKKSGDHRCRECEISWKRKARASGRIDGKGRSRHMGPSGFLPRAEPE